MRTRKKILLGVVTLALPATSFAVLGAPTMFAGAAAPAYPVACKMSATVTFNPPLTKAGTDTTNKAAVTTTTISGGSLTQLSVRRSRGCPEQRGHSDHGHQHRGHQGRQGRQGPALHHRILPGLCLHQHPEVLEEPGVDRRLDRGYGRQLDVHREEAVGRNQLLR